MTGRALVAAATAAAVLGGAGPARARRDRRDLRRRERQGRALEDRFGLSWQIVPERLYELVQDPDPAVADAANRAMYGMHKIVIADLEAAVASR